MNCHKIEDWRGSRNTKDTTYRHISLEDFVAYQDQQEESQEQ